MNSLKIMLIAAWIGLICSVAHGQLPGTQLNTISPVGGQIGGEVEVTVAGANQDDLTGLIFSHSKIVATQLSTPAGEFDTGPTPVNNKFKVQIASDVPAGIYEARAVGRFGVSNPRFFVVGSAPVMIDNGGNQTLDTAQEVKPGDIVSGQTDANRRDYYKISLAAGQRILAECWAARLGSRANTVVVVYDADGRELARNNDSLGLDSLLDFTAPEAAEYIISVRDFVYQGNTEYFYWLDFNPGSHIDYISPPIGTAGSNATYTVVGRNLEGGKPLEGVVADGVPLESVQQTINLTASGDPDSIGIRNMVRDRIEQTVVSVSGTYQPMMSSDLPLVSESDGNDTNTAATPMEAPGIASGQFYPAGDVDWYEFSATKDQVFIIEVISHQLGIPVDPTMLVQRVTIGDDEQETVATVTFVDDPSDRNGKIGQDFDYTTDDPSYRFVVPADGKYRVRVTDQYSLSRADPRLQYILRIRNETPRFGLTAKLREIKTANANEIKMFAPVLRKADCLLIDVQVDRIEGFQGVVSVSVEGLPAGVVCKTAEVGASQTLANLILQSTADVAPWQGMIKVVGTAMWDEKEVKIEANYGMVVWGSANKTATRAYYRSSNTCWLSVINAEDGAALVTVGDGNILETSRGGKLEVPVTVARGAGFEGDMKLVATNVPAEIKPADLTFKPDKNEQNLVIDLKNAKAKAGVYTYYLRGDGKVKRGRNAEVVARAEAKQAHLATLVETANAAVTAATEEKNKAEGDDAKAKAEEAFKAAQATQKRTTDAKTAADKALDAAKKADAPKDVVVAVVSTPIQIRVVDSPFTIADVSGAVTAGEKIEVKVTIERKYGFVDPVDVAFKIPGGLKGVTIAKLQIAKDANEGALQLTATDAATAGDHAIELNATAKFNAVPVTANGALKLSVAAAATEEE